jgi:hypothetical protein
MLVVDPHHWLDKNGDLPLEPRHLRAQILRVVRFIEYGGPLDVLHGRETLIECRKRPRGKPCPGLMWVVKTAEHSIHAYCPVCNDDEAMIDNWERTHWAEGPMEAVSLASEPH